MSKITKAVEDRLLVAIEKTAALVNDGMRPNEAIAKAAVEGGIPPGHVHMLVHAYNTGRTTRQRQAGNDVFEKAADFEMADTATVLEKLYPSHVKTAAAIQQNNVVSTVYAISPHGVLDRRASRQVKTAKLNVDWRSWSRGEYADENGNPQQRLVTAEVAPPLPQDQVHLMKKAYCDAERKQREVNEARRKMAAAKDRMAATFMELTEHFKTADAQPIPIVREQAALLHGGKAQQLIDEIVKVSPGLLSLERHKRASYQPHQLERADGAAYALISQFLDNLDEYQQTKRAYETTLSNNRSSVEELLAPFVASPASVLDDPVFSTKEEKQAASVVPALMGASFASTIMKNIGDSVVPQQARVNKATKSLTDPAHEQELRNIAASASLQDMLLNDPVISSYSPDEVISAYNDMVEVAPRTANQRMILQALMRKRMTQGVLDPFDVDQLIGMEDKQRKIQSYGAGDAAVVS